VAGHHQHGEVGRRFLATLLGGDPRIGHDEHADRWHVREHPALWRPVAEAEYVVVDLETTGGGPLDSSITEIGAVRLRGGRLVDRFSTLVNPRRRIQPFVVDLTGITDGMVRDAPPIERVLPAFLEFAGDAVLVAHNAAFDLGYLGRALAAIDGGTITNPVLCTLRLARRLLPHLKRRTLDAVAADLGVECGRRHRALDDARITGEVLAILVERAHALGIERVADFVRYQRLAIDGKPVTIHVPPERVEAAPSAPGVYHLLDDAGRVVYVGRARQLRERLRSYFAEDRDHPRYVAEMLRDTYDVRVQPTGSELAAALLEARQIRDLRPAFNRRGWHLPRLWFVKLGRSGRLPRLWVSGRLGMDGAQYLGPLATREAAEEARDLLARAFGLRVCVGKSPSDVVNLPCRVAGAGPCLAPCAASIGPDAYATRVAAFRAWLAGAPATTAVAADREALGGLRRRLVETGWVAGGKSFVALVPGVEPGSAVLFAVLAGRLAVEAQLGATADLVAAIRQVRGLWDRFHQGGPTRLDLEGMSVVAGWLRDRRGEGVVLPLDGPDALARQLDALTITLDDLRQRGPLPHIDALA
jgi:DNA polymerase-3 subunit epsilon